MNRITTRHTSTAAGRGGIRATYKGKSFTWPYDHAQNAAMNRWEAAQGLATKLGLGTLPKEASGDVKRRGQYVGLYWNVGRESNPARTEADHEAARELMLYADNTGELYPQKQAILKNLAKKMQKDQYIPEKATKLWMYWMDEAARRYTKEFGTGSGYGVFNAATRRLAAGWEEREMRDRVPEYGNILDKYREKNPGRRSIHTAKWDRCVKDVKSKGGSYDPYAVCTAQLGERGSVKKGHRRDNPYEPGKSTSVTRAEATQYLKERYREQVAKFPRLSEIPEAEYVKQNLAATLRNARNRAKWARERGSNHLPSVRKVYYIICAHKGAENYYLARSGKLTRSQASAQRFATAAAAIDKAKAHLRAYTASRKYRFDLKLAY